MKKIIPYILLPLIVIMLIGVVAVVFRPSLINDKQSVKEKFATPSSHFLNWRGAEIHYTDEGEGFPLLLIHGFGGHHRNFNKITEELKKEYRVIRMDLPGFGLSDCPVVDESKPEYVQLYKDFFSFFLDTLHLDSFYVAGNSMGGMMAWNLAVNRPEQVKKLVLLASAGYDLEKTAKGLFIIKFKWLAKLMEKGLPDFMSWDGAKRCYADETKINADEVLNNNMITNREGNVKHMLSMAGDLHFPDTAWIQQIKCPTLIIWGMQDEIITVEHAQRFKRDIPNAQLLIFDTCGHVPMIERMEDTKQAMSRFFAE